MATCLPSPPSSVHSNEDNKHFPDFAPRSLTANDGNNNAGQRAVKILKKAVDIKREMLSQRMDDEWMDSTDESEEDESDVEDTEESEYDDSDVDEEDLYVLVRSDRDDMNPLELPINGDDGSLPLSTLQAYFPGASGLGQRNDKTGYLRIAYKLVDGRLVPLRPYAFKTMMDVVYPRREKKRVASDDEDSDGACPPPAGKRRRIEPTPFSFEGFSSSKPNFKFASGAPTFSDVAQNRGQRGQEPVWNQPRKSAQQGQTGNRVGCFNGSPTGPTTMIVKDLPHQFDVKDLERHFTRFGPVHSVQLCNDPKRATVRFGDTHSANQAFGSHSVNGACLVALPAAYREDRKASMFLSSIPRGMSPDTLIEYFTNYGQVLYVYIPRQTGAFKKYGFVQFKEPASAEKLDQFRRDHTINGSVINVGVRRF